MAETTQRFSSLLVLLLLSGCALIPGAIVGGVAGAILQPLISPQVDRALGVTHNKWVDPGGVTPVQDYDSSKPSDTQGP